MSTSSSNSTALDLFEKFLVDYHETGSGVQGFEAFCTQHPEHADVFRRWWEQLVQTGEVSAIPSSETVRDMPIEGDRYGRYRIVRELGRGSQGSVFLADDSELGRRVALKVLPAHRALGADHRRRFAREAELASRLDHPGLCTIYERDTSSASCYLAMRYVEGETLAAAIARARRKSEVEGEPGRTVRFGDAELAERDAIHEVLELFEGIADALHVAHGKGLIHRDVKPGNIIVDERRQPVLLDFGLARDVESGPALTMSGDLVGTPAYMSPEQLAAHRIDLDRRTDIYSLAATLYECVTLRRPFEAPTRNELYQQILTVEPSGARRHNPAIPRDLEIVLQTALDKDRNRRYQTAAGFAEDLRRVRKLEAIRARPAGPLLKMRRWTQRNPVIAVSMAVVFLALAAGLVVSLSFYSETRRAQAGFDRLADRARLRNAKNAAKDLHPGFPENIPRFEAWLGEHGNPLHERMSAHESYLADLRKSALPYTAKDRMRDRVTHPDRARVRELKLTVHAAKLAAENARSEDYREMWGLAEAEVAADLAAVEKRIGEFRTWRFARTDEQTAHDAIAALVEELREFTAPNGPFETTKWRLAWAKNLAARREQDRAAWDKARKDAAANKLYGSRELRPQAGLVPIGKDPESGLLEFAHLRSGKVPVRDEKTKRLVITGETGMVFVLVPGGKFVMGNDINLPAQPLYERFETEVELDWFFVSKYELTRGQWRRLAGPSPGEPPGNLLLSVRTQVTGAHPIESITWVAARQLLHPHGLQLPTEAQWEFAARGGCGRDLFWWGNSRPRGDQKVGNLRDRAFIEATRQRGRTFRYDDGYIMTGPVGISEPNGYGLFDVSGNVSELCRDAFFAAASLELFDFRSGDGLHNTPATKSKRAIRGGSFETGPAQAYLASRAGRHQDKPSHGVGVRPIRPVH